jgi:hypothetical protein
MLAKIAPRFVISGVIQNAYYANYMAVDLTKQIIGDSYAVYDFDYPKRFTVSCKILRNATFLGISRRCPNRRSLPISSKLRSMTKPVRNLQCITR